MKLLTLFLASCLIVGCTPITKVSPPADLAAPCPALPEFTGTTAGDLFRHAVKVANSYRECADRHAALVKAIE